MKKKKKTVKRYSSPCSYKLYMYQQQQQQKCSIKIDRVKPKRDIYKDK